MELLFPARRFLSDSRHLIWIWIRLGQRRLRRGRECLRRRCLDRPNRCARNRRAENRILRPT